MPDVPGDTRVTKQLLITTNCRDVAAIRKEIVCSVKEYPDVRVHGEQDDLVKIVKKVGSSDSLTAFISNSVKIIDACLEMQPSVSLQTKQLNSGM